MKLSSIQKTLVVASALLPIVLARRWEASLGWCRSTTNDHLYEGDFNGDGQTDLLCHRTTNGYKWISFANPRGEFSGTSWEGLLGSCVRYAAELHFGDFNGDGRDDMLCHDTINGYKWISYANAQGNFSGSTTWYLHSLRWCGHSGAELHIGDFNGDGRDDMLCHDTNNGYKWISFANTAGNFADRTSWEAGTLRWCGHAGSELHIGDFNGDGKDDMLCHDSNNGYKWIAYANSHGNFAGGTDWEAGIGWCYNYGAQLAIGDANGDGRDDLYCHYTNNGYKWVAFSNAHGSFSGRKSWQADLQWCYLATDQLFLGDYDGDAKTDMLCHNTANGHKEVIYAPFDQ